MRNLLFPALLMTVAALTATPVAAQQRLDTVPPPPLHMTNPSVSLSAPATSPLEQQMQDDYATQLRGAQQQLMQQNSSGVTRPEMGINHALDGFTPR